MYLWQRNFLELFEGENYVAAIGELHGRLEVVCVSVCTVDPIITLLKINDGAFKFCRWFVLACTLEEGGEIYA